MGRKQGMSNNDRWMPVYVADYLGDTMHLTTLQHGALFLCLMHYWRTGPLPDNDQALAQIARTDLRTWKREIAPMLRPLFAANGSGVLHQKRMDQELERWAEISGKRREAGKAGAEATWKRNGGKPPDKPGGKQMANATSLPVDNPANGIPNATPKNGKCHDFAITPLPVQRKNLLSREGEEMRGRARANPSDVKAVAASAVAALKVEKPPYTPSREFQLSALQVVRGLPQPQEPERTVEQQLAILRGEVAA
jgi:uncharacterized protein YdaU (DUF1376 family)